MRAFVRRLEMSKASQQYSSPGSCWDAVSEEQDVGKEVGVPSEGSECRFKVCGWKAGGINE